MTTAGAHSCTICGAYTQEVLCGNRLLVHARAYEMPVEHRPALLWRCEDHQQYLLRTASAVRATEAGDVLFTLSCGHEMCWVCRGRDAYTAARLQHALTTRQIRLDQPQRCYVCGDLLEESEATP